MIPILLSSILLRPWASLAIAGRSSWGACPGIACRRPLRRAAWGTCSGIWDAAPKPRSCPSACVQVAALPKGADIEVELIIAL